MSTSHLQWRGTAATARIKDLRLDAENARLAERHRDADQAEIADILRMSHQVLPIAESLADNGYFTAEPLIVIANPAESGTWIVVEGNRRATALFGLTNPEVREVFDSPKWDELAERATLTESDEIPVVIHENREAARTEIARVHVGHGKLEWPPFAQARYISSQVENDRAFEAIAQDMGLTVGETKTKYRDLMVFDQAKNSGVSLSETGEAYSIMTVTMSRTKLREHVGAPTGAHTKVGEPPVPEAKMGELRELMQWVFGDKDHEPKIEESRQMTKLASVVASPVGLSALRGGASLDKATEKIRTAGLNPRVRLVNRLRTGHNALAEALNDLSDFADDEEAIRLVEDIEGVVNSITETVEEIRN